MTIMAVRVGMVLRSDRIEREDVSPAALTLVCRPAGGRAAQPRAVTRRAAHAAPPQRGVHRAAAQRDDRRPPMTATWPLPAARPGRRAATRRRAAVRDDRAGHPAHRHGGADALDEHLAVHAGNFGFKRDLTNQGERAIATVLDVVQAGALGQPTPRARPMPRRSNYSAAILATNDQGVPLALLTDAAFAAASAWPATTSR